ncbi:MAG: hypothetical protein ABJB12_10660 [Pseudomonadota bacterium]
MRWLIGVLVFGCLPACLQLGKALDSDGGASGAGGGGGEGAHATTGTNCGVDPNSGIALCLGISSCPAVRVDPDQFPDCGFRISGATIDLECLCGDALCPMGSAASCLDAKGLLADQSAQGVCAAVADGRCTIVKQTSVSSSSMCDKNCRAECGGDPNCVTLCGC